MFEMIGNDIEIVEFSYKNHNLPGGEFELDPKISRHIGKLPDGQYFTEIEFELINEDDNPFPMDIRLVVKGIFEFIKIKDEEAVFEFMRKQAVHIIYPYIRSTVSVLTSTAMVKPIVLPIVNAFTLFDD